ncbi:MAG TPA: hypothetical protein DCS30_02215, partial [Rhizobiales bacterium]|nr:hypothetical protein [Hyphomicrobiales bacterium]
PAQQTSDVAPLQQTDGINQNKVGTTPVDPVAANMQPATQTPEDLWGFLRLLDDEGDLKSLAELEAEIIQKALDHYDYRMSAVARQLGIGRSTLYRKLKEYGLEETSSEPKAS